MTQHRPLFWSSPDLRQMSDADLDVVSYYIRKRYANYLNTVSTTEGIVTTSQANSLWVSIGTATNSYRTSGSLTNPDDNDSSSPPDTTFGSDQTGTSSSVTTFYQYKDQTTAYQTAATINATGMLYWSDPDLKIGPTDEQDLLDSIVTDVQTQMTTGDEVGTYRIDTSTPSGGTWVDKGTWFADTKYGGTEATYKLYLKTANTSDPTTSNNMATWNSSAGEIQLVDSDDWTISIIDSIWMNVLRRRHPLYVVDTTGGGTARGTFYDKKYSSTLDTLSGPSSGVYTREYIPTGGMTTVSTYYFYISGNRTP